MPTPTRSFIAALRTALLLVLLLLAPSAFAGEPPPPPAATVPGSAAISPPEPAAPKVVLYLSDDQVVPAIVDVTVHFQGALRRRWPGKVMIDVETSDLAWIDDADYRRGVHDLLLVKYGARRPDVIVAISVAQLRLALDLRESLWPDVPIVFGVESEQSVAALSPQGEVTGRFGRYEIDRTLREALRLRPETRRVAVILGDGGHDRLYTPELERALRELPPGIEITDLRGLSLTAIEERAKTLPESTLVFFISILRDGAGMPAISTDVLRRLRAIASGPIISIHRPMLGEGILGGVILDYGACGDQLAELTQRVLAGERASAIRVEPFQDGHFEVDARELDRFQIPRSRLPPGAVLHFDPPTLWEQYRGYVVGSITLALAQAALIAWLLVERRRRRVAELDARRSFADLAHIKRVTEMSELTGSIAHEINQPLAAILANASAIRRMLAVDPLDKGEVSAAIEDILADDRRAGEVIRRTRRHLEKRDVERSEQDLSEIAREVAHLVANDALLRDARIELDLAPAPLLVIGDGVQLQQVVLNLVINALDAVASQPPDRKRVLLRTRLVDGRAELRVEDTGKGFAEGEIEQLFEPFFTTKPEGLGMGLSISRTILESHGGQIVAAPRPGGGAVMCCLLSSLSVPRTARIAGA